MPTMEEPTNVSLFKEAPLEGGESGAEPGPPEMGASGAGPAGAGGELTGVTDGVGVVGAKVGGVPAGGDAVVAGVGAKVGGDAVVGGAGTGDTFGAIVGAVVGDCAMAEPTKRASNTKATTLAEPIFDLSP